MSGCEAKVVTIGEQIVENERIKKDKANPKYMRERAKDEKKKLEKEALPEATEALIEAKALNHAHSFAFTSYSFTHISFLV